MLERFIAGQRGNAAIEFALVVPVLLALMAGIVELGRAFEAYSAVNRLATRYAASWADCNDKPAGICQTELAQYTSANSIKNFVPQLTNTVTLRMIEVTMSGTTPTVVYASPSGATLTAGETAIAAAAIGSGQTGVVVTASYTHTLAFFQQLMTPIMGANRSVSYTVAQLRS